MDNREKAIRLGLTAGTMLDRPQLEYLYDLALQAPDGIGVECGVARGGSLLCWAAARVKRGPILGVDNLSLNRWDFIRDNLRKWGPNIIFLRGLSWEVGALMEMAQGVAFCFIDACHDEAGIGRDVLTWPKTIKPGGIIVYHDYAAPKCPAVKRCVDAWQAEAQWEYLGAVGSTAAFRRPG